MNLFRKIQPFEYRNMGSPFSYDLFISYHWREHETIDQLARALTARGLRVFLDRWYLRPGHAWQTEREMEG